MTNEDPLARKLATLTTKGSFTGSSLNLGTSGSPEAMNHVLQAIDDTMLLRHVVFAVGESAVTLRISGKRLLSVVAATKDMNSPDGLIDQPLNADTPDALDQVAAILEDLITKTGTLTLNRLPAESEAKQSGSGVGVQALRASWIAVQSAPKMSPLENFRTMCKPVAVAIIMLSDGEVETVWGTQLEVDRLEGIFGSEWVDFDRKHQSHIASESGHLIRIMSGFGSENQAVVLAKLDGNQCLAMIELDGVPQLAAAWARVVPKN